MPLAALAFAVLPESVSFLLHKRGDQAAARAILQRAAPGEPLPEAGSLRSGGGAQPATSIAAVLQDGRLRMTLMFWVVEFIVLMGYYLLVNWVPTLLTRGGLSAEASLLGSAALNIGGTICGLFVAQLSNRFGARRVMSAVLVLGAAALGMMVAAGVDVPFLMAAIFVAGGAWIAGQAVLILLVNDSYPMSIRATGVGWVMTAGRLGAIASAALVAVPLGWGWDAGQVLLLPVVPALVGAVCILLATPAEARFPAPVSKERPARSRKQELRLDRAAVSERLAR